MPVARQALWLWLYRVVAMRPFKSGWPCRVFKWWRVRACPAAVAGGNGSGGGEGEGTTGGPAAAVWAPADRVGPARGEEGRLVRERERD